MEINADFTKRVVIRPEDVPWTPSPSPGVERRMLDRIGEEVARATSFVRFAPGSRFEPHLHELGEEFLVLDGTFGDETGDFPAGFYVRNPPGSRHAPSTREGCTIFVKLRQFDPRDDRRVAVDTRRAEGWERGPVPGVETLPLHAFGDERVVLERWAARAWRGLVAHPRGQEVLVLEGEFADRQGTYPAGTWIRNPPGSRSEGYAQGGCLLWIKEGHLATG